MFSRATSYAEDDDDLDWRDDQVDDTDDTDDADDEPGAFRRAVGTASLLVALGGLLITGWQALSKTHRDRIAEADGELLPPLNTWEAEGGQNQLVADAGPLSPAPQPRRVVGPADNEPIEPAI